MPAYRPENARRKPQAACLRLRPARLGIAVLLSVSIASPLLPALAPRAAAVEQFSTVASEQTQSPDTVSTRTTGTDTDRFQQAIDDAEAAYQRALDNADDVAAQLDEIQGQIEELKQRIPAQQKKSDDAVRSLYKMQQASGGLADFVLSAGSIQQVFDNVEYLNHVVEASNDEIERLSDMEDELEQDEREVEALRDDSQARVAAAAAAIQDARDAREAEIQKATSIVAENAARPVSNEGANWGCDQDIFVMVWTPRLDAYLEGTPLAGEGKAFATAAWRYGIDPRWSAAISNTESSNGAICFNPYNAWGWGDNSWSSWDEAIDAHALGLSSGYGYSLTREAAAKYCPPNTDFWYENTAANMAKIYSFS